MENKTVSTCFSTLGCTEKSFSEIINLCKNNHISNIEIRGIGGQLDNRKIPEFSSGCIEETARVFMENGIRPIVLGTSSVFHNSEKYDSAIEEGKESIIIAEKLGALGIRVFGDKVSDGMGDISRVIDGIGILCKAAKDTHVSILLEVHGDFNRVETLNPIIEAFRSEPKFGLIWDIGHTRETYGGNWVEFYKTFKPFIKHVHIKDANGEGLVLPGCGDIPVKEMISYLIADGYKGAFSLEWEKKWHPELASIETALEAFVTLVESIDI